MKASIKKRFKKFQEQYSSDSSYTCFARAVKGQDLKDKTISFWFNKLVDKNDYCKKERMGIVKHLRWLTKQDESS